jgi:repressor LexA
MSDQLTATERRVYEYLIDFLAEHTYQPSIREIGRRFQIKSTKTVSDVLQGLARKGFIERDPARSRGVRLVGYTGVGGTQAVPYYAAVRSSEQALDPSLQNGHLVLDRRLAGSERSFMLRAEGESMRDRGILAGDYVIVDPTLQPALGAVVAARVAGKVALRGWQQRGGATVLVPANPDEREIVVQAGDDIPILGTVVGVVRSMHTGDPLAAPLDAPQSSAMVSALTPQSSDVLQ